MKPLHQADTSFIKFDLEGHELPALHGCIKTIQRQKPILAIAGYHRWTDLWQIPLLVQKMQPAYRFHLGLHAHNTFDAVFYAD